MKGKVIEVQKCRHSKLTSNNVQVVSEDLGKLRETSLGVDSIQSRTLAFSTVLDLATLKIVHDMMRLLLALQNVTVQQESATLFSPKTLYQSLGSSTPQQSKPF